MGEKHFFSGKEDGESFLLRLENNYGKDDRYTQKSIAFIRGLADFIGWGKIAILDSFYNDENVGNLHEIYILANEYHPTDSSDHFWITSEEISLESDGTIRIWVDGLTEYERVDLNE